MSALQEAQKLLDQLKAAYSRKDFNGADNALSQLKLKLIQLPSLPPVSQPSPTAQQELALARDAMEHAALLAIRQQNEQSMERAFAQLKVLYADTRGVLPPSPQEPLLVGLDLLRLLVANRIAEFHTQLELIEPEAQAHPNVAVATQLERWLMEGAYNKVLSAAKQPPSDLHAALMSQLATTVRDEVASCSERAYAQLKVSDAQRMMMFDSEAAVLQYAQQHNWQVRSGYIVFQGDGSVANAGGKPAKEVPPLGHVNNALVYAKELLRIV